MKLKHLNVDIIVYGPYHHNDGRPFIIIQYDKRKKSQSLTRFCVEHVLDYQLDPSLEVDHIDRDFNNDSIDNLQLLPKNLHAVKDARLKRFVRIQCAWCGKITVKLWRYVKHNQDRSIDCNNSLQRYCSKQCAGHSTQVKTEGKLLSIEDTFVIQPPTITGTQLSNLLSADQCNNFYALRAGLVESGIHRALKQPRAKAHTGSSPVPGTEEVKIRNKCKICLKEISDSATTCRNCVPKKTKIDWPDTNILIQMVDDSNYIRVAKELGISDNAIRKRIKNH